MAAGSWIAYNTFKSRAFSGTANVDKAVKIKLVTSSYTPSLAHLALTTTTISSNAAANTGWTSSVDTFTSGEMSLVATGNNYRLDCSATSQATATGGSIVAKYAVLAEATDNQLVAYCDLNTSTSVGVTVTSGNTLTINFPTSGLFLLNGATS